MMHAYSRSDYEDAVAKFSDGSQSAPQCLRLKVGNRYGQYDRIETEWPSMSLEDKIGHLALLIGRFVPGTTASPRHIITYGYEMLCRTGRLA